MSIRRWGCISARTDRAESSSANWMRGQNRRLDGGSETLVWKTNGMSIGLG